MNIWIIGILIGLASGLIIFPICLGIFNAIRNTIERRKVKKMINKGEFLVPIDTKDYDVKAWQGHKYGNINPNDFKQDYEKFNDKMFKKKIVEGINQEEDNEFMVKISKYIKQMKELGYSNEEIINELKKKEYSDALIKEIFNYTKEERK